MTIEESYSPMLHRLNQAIRTRAVKPNGSITSPAEILMKYSSPPKDVVAAAKGSLESLIAAANVKKGKLTKREGATI
jgi:ATP-dependent DNA helicase 2 subunit 2